MSENQTTGESWDGLLVNYLKANSFEEEEITLVCTSIKIEGKELELNLERNEGKEKFTFGCNVTNKVFLKENGIKAPKETIGKKVTFKKITAMNPTTKREGPSLRICKIE